MHAEVLMILAVTIVMFATAFKPTLTKVNNNGIKSFTRLQMASTGGKQSKFGIFSPAVYFLKFALGEAKLNKVSF